MLSALGTIQLSLHKLTGLHTSYILDGNAHFFTAVEAVRRGLAAPPSTDAIVVGIGYPDCGHYVFSSRRAYDLTPPCDPYVPSRSWDGKCFPLPHGGANKLLDFIQGPVRSRIFDDLFPRFKPEREVLAGHSFGSLCAMHALFARSTCFDTSIAASPTVWWKEQFILSEEKKFLDRLALARDMMPPSLYISYGHYEQYPRRRKAYSGDEYAKRRPHALSLRTKDDSDDMAERLRGSGLFKLVKAKEYVDEDHGSVAGPALSWAISDVLDLDRFA